MGKIKTNIGSVYKNWYLDCIKYKHYFIDEFNLIIKFDMSTQKSKIWIELASELNLYIQLNDQDLHSDSFSFQRNCLVIKS